MSDLVRIRDVTSGTWYCGRNSGLTPDKQSACLYERCVAEAIKEIATSLVELEEVDPVEPTPACRCAELAKALEAWKQFADECKLREVKVPLWAALLNEKAAVLTEAALSGVDAPIAAHDAAKDAEIERLRKALQDVVFVLEEKNNPELYLWRRAELAGQYAKAALDGGRA